MAVLEGGGVHVTTVDAGSIRLDGGAMFGVVPKPLWSRKAPCDARNRISLAMRCLLIRTPSATILVDSGLGNKEDAKFHEIYGVRNEGAPTRLESSLQALGVAPADVDVVVNTHLHFDHAGGNTTRTEDGEIVAAFPDAEYVIHRGEWEYAHLDNERVRASYLAHNFDPLAETGQVRWVEGDRATVAPGVETIRTPGHTPYHQSILITLGERRLLYLADLVPTRAHLPLPWIMGYDVEPLVTLESKRTWIEQATREGWILGFEHDPRIAWGTATPGDRPGRVALTDPVFDPIANPVAEDEFEEEGA
ncbi:MAG: MBL fold metallo-hydrolase [Gemmatimonadota bacterium]|jgi:glyoxylase-like metal-dependent hydrolase (beta-lactamase superfamily II)